MCKGGAGSGFVPAVLGLSFICWVCNMQLKQCCLQPPWPRKHEAGIPNGWLNGP